VGPNSGKFIVLFVFYTQLTTLVLVWMGEFSFWLILVRPHVLCFWLFWPHTLKMQYDVRMLTYIMMMAISHLFAEYGHCTVGKRFNQHF